MIGKYKPSEGAQRFADLIIEMLIGDQEYIKTMIGRPEVVEAERDAIAFAFDAALAVAKGTK